MHHVQTKNGNTSRITLEDYELPPKTRGQKAKVQKKATAGKGHLMVMKNKPVPQERRTRRAKTKKRAPAGPQGRPRVRPLPRLDITKHSAAPLTMETNHPVFSSLCNNQDIAYSLDQMNVDNTKKLIFELAQMQRNAESRAQTISPDLNRLYDFTHPDKKLTKENFYMDAVERLRHNKRVDLDKVSQCNQKAKKRNYAELSSTEIDYLSTPRRRTSMDPKTAYLSTGVQHSPISDSDPGQSEMDDKHDFSSEPKNKRSSSSTSKNNNKKKQKSGRSRDNAARSRRHRPRDQTRTEPEPTPAPPEEKKDVKGEQFWNSLNPYFDFPEDKTLDILRPEKCKMTDAESSIPVLGSHYLDIWAETDEEVLDLSGIDSDREDPFQWPPKEPQTDSSSSTSSTSKPRDIVFTRHSLTQRLHCALIEKNLDANPHPTELRQVKLKEDTPPLTQDAPVAFPKPSSSSSSSSSNSNGTGNRVHDEDLLSDYTIEERTMIELRSVGLWGNAEWEVPQGAKRKDDEVCIYLRNEQIELKKVLEKNEGHRRKVLEKAEKTLDRNARFEKLHDAYRRLNGLFARYRANPSSVPEEEIKARLDHVNSIEKRVGTYREISGYEPGPLEFSGEPRKLSPSPSVSASSSSDTVSSSSSSSSSGVGASVPPSPFVHNLAQQHVPSFTPSTPGGGSVDLGGNGAAVGGAGGHVSSASMSAVRMDIEDHQSPMMSSVTLDSPIVESKHLPPAPIILSIPGSTIPRNSGTSHQSQTFYDSYSPSSPRNNDTAATGLGDNLTQFDGGFW